MKFFTIALLCMFGVLVAQAKPYDYKELREVVQTKDPAAIKVYLDSVELTGDGQKGNKVYWLSRVEIMENPDIPAKTILDGVETKAAAVGLTDQDRINLIKLQMLYGPLKDYETGYQMAKSMKGRLVEGYRPFFARALKKYDEAIAGFAAVNNYHLAANCAYMAKDKLKTYEYGRKALLSSYQRKPLVCSKILQWILSFDYSDTDITADDLKELLVKVNRKYPPIGDDVKKWESFLAQVRFKLETYK